MKFPHFFISETSNYCFIAGMHFVFNPERGNAIFNWWTKNLILNILINFCS